MRLGREQVLHIAELAKLGITEEETERFAELPMAYQASPAFRYHAKT